MSVSVDIVGISRYKKYGKVLPASIVTHTYNTQQYLVIFFKDFLKYLHDTYKIPINTYKKTKGQHYYL